MEAKNNDRTEIRNIRRRKRRLRVLQMRAAAAVALLVIIVIIKAVGSGKESKADASKDVETKVVQTVTEAPKPVIVVDAGHGGEDPGCEANGGELYEKDVNIEIAKKLQKELEERGYEVIMTRTGDTFLSPEERAKIGNREGVDALISIHQNILENDTVTSGIETWYNMYTNSDSSSLARLVQNGAAKATGAENGGIKNSTKLILIRDTKAPSCLIETGFLSNPQERQNLTSSSYQQQLAEGIAAGIDQFMEGKTKDEVTHMGSGRNT